MSETWLGLTNKIMNNSLARRLPVVGAFELTGRCNFRCRMCYICKNLKDNNSESRELSAEEWIRIGKEARDAGLFFLTLTGGEVFLRKDFRTIYEGLSQLGLRIIIYSNASLITPKVATWLKEAPPATVLVTLYGSNPKTYEMVTGCATAYNNTIRGLEALKAEGITTTLRTTVIKGNYKEFEQMYEIAQRYGKGFGIVDYISERREPGEATDPIGNRLNPKDLTEFLDFALNYKKDKSSNKSNEIKINEDAIPDMPFEDIDPEAVKKLTFKCVAGRSAFWATWEGKLTPCGLLNDPYSSLLDQDFSTAWEELKRKSKEVPQCLDCIDCELKPYCKTCPGRLKSESGSFTEKTEYLCELAKYNRLLKI